MSAPDPNWVAIVVGIVSSLITAAVSAAVIYGALRSWMAKREVREEVLREDVADHEQRLRTLERGPMDYVR